MSDFAILDGNLVTNIIVADDATILQLLFPDETIHEVTEQTGPAFIGGDLVAGVFRSPSPFPSWSWNDGSWVAPTAVPDDGRGYMWDEESLSWVAIPKPEEQPEA